MSAVKCMVCGLQVPQSGAMFATPAISTKVICAIIFQRTAVDVRISRRTAMNFQLIWAVLVKITHCAASSSRMVRLMIC